MLPLGSSHPVARFRPRYPRRRHAGTHDRRGLFALGIACWFARRDGQSGAVRGLVAAMLFYNLAVVAIFTVARIAPGPTGVAFWPVVMLHAGMSVWCITSVLHKKSV